MGKPVQVSKYTYTGDCSCRFGRFFFSAVSQSWDMLAQNQISPPATRTIDVHLSTLQTIHSHQSSSVSERDSMWNASNDVSGPKRNQVSYGIEHMCCASEVLKAYHHVQVGSVSVCHYGLCKPTIGKFDRMQ